MTESPAIPLPEIPLTLPGYPEDYRDQPDINDVLECLRDYHAPLLVTGKAGTGKSTLVRFIRDCGAFPNTIVLAPTGVAALNIGGQTLHSFFRLPHQIITPEALKGQRYNKLWKKADIIIVDEVSMVRPDIIDGMDMILRRARHNDDPFGGCRLMFIGDFYQLPPVVAGRESGLLEQLGYDTPFAYSAKILSHVELQRITLHQVHRQSDDAFVDILSNLRQGVNLSRALARLNAECVRPARENSQPVLLAGTNATAARYNARGLASITAPEFSFASTSKDGFNLSGDRLPAPETLILKIGARVMALRNDSNKRWVNGSLGTVTAITDDAVKVRFDHSGTEEEVKPASWETVKYDWDEKTGKPIANVAGTFTQIPLMLAWAMTIHKAQGLTLDDVRIDLERRAFASGQTYVALSRARSLDGLSLTRALTRDDIIVEQRHDDFFGVVRDLDDFDDVMGGDVADALTIVRAPNALHGRLPVYALPFYDPETLRDIEPVILHDLGITYNDRHGQSAQIDLTAHLIAKTHSGESSILYGRDIHDGREHMLDISKILAVTNLETGEMSDSYIRRFLNDLGT